MRRFENSRDYGFLVLFSNGSLVARTNLLHKGYSAEFIDRHVSNGWIAEVRKSDIGDPVYGITNAGKRYRDA